MSTFTHVKAEIVKAGFQVDHYYGKVKVQPGFPVLIGESAYLVEADYDFIRDEMIGHGIIISRWTL